jgi:hypothetical protein
MGLVRSRVYWITVESHGRERERKRKEKEERFVRRGRERDEKGKDVSG